MKNKIISVLSLGIICSLSSCDSGGGVSNSSDPLTNPTGLAAALTVPVAGDLIRFNSTTTPNPVLPGLIFEGKSTIIANTSYIYERVDTNVFHIDVITPNANNLTSAINSTIGEPTDLASRLRAILLRNTANFTAAEIQEIVNILNPVGANLIVDPVNPLQIDSTATREYRMRITSDNAAKQIGSVGGVYIVEETNFVVGFRAPTQAELNTFRLLSINHKIPFITTTQNVKQITERGTFVMELENVNNAPR